VEFTLIVPVFMFVLLGILDFGRVGFYYVATSALSKSAARYAAVYNNGTGFANCPIVSYVKQQTDAATMAGLTMPGGCSPGTSPGNTTPPNPLTSAYQPPVGTAWIFIDRSSLQTNGTITVSIVYAFRPTTPMISELTGTIYTVATSTMNTEF